MRRNLFIRIDLIIGLLLMLVGALDPMEGSLLIVPGLAFVALGAYLEQDRHRALLMAAFVLGAFGVAWLFILSAYGGLGGSTGRSMWWALIVLPYPVGWLLGMVYGVRMLVHAFRHREAPPHAA